MSNDFRAIVTNRFEWNLRELRERARLLLTGRRRPLLKLSLMREFAHQPTASQIIAPTLVGCRVYVQPTRLCDQWIYRSDSAFWRQKKKEGRL